MSKINLYNTLSRKKEEFKPINIGRVGLYTCGPTVYNYAHIGNLRTYIFEDILKRVLEFNGYEVKHVMNITDVGHLTGDRDMGKDKLEEEALKEGKSVWTLANFYTDEFIADLKSLNIIEPSIWARVTDNILEQIEMVKILEQKGYAYTISDGIYFDTSKFPDYNKLSHLKLEELQEGARVEKNDEKRNATDFALWKFSPKGEKRQMEWWFKGKFKGRLVTENNYKLGKDNHDTIGFPGWHIECSVISAKYLDVMQDIHCGGIDHINVHHTNEIAQSEAATGEKFFNYWMHGAFLNIEGGKKMAKSDNNFLTLKNALINKNINPLVYRFAALQVHYRKPMEYSEKSIKNAQNGLDHLYNQVRELANGVKFENIQSQGKIDEKFLDKFLKAINNDLNIPQALGVVQELLKSDNSNFDKLKTLFKFDNVLGLRMIEVLNVDEIPEEISRLLELRKQMKEQKQWEESDRLRSEIERNGFVVEDTNEGMRVYKK